MKYLIMVLALSGMSYAYRKTSIFDTYQSSFKIASYDYSYTFHEPDTDTTFTCFVRLSKDDKKFLKNSLLGYADTALISAIDDTLYKEKTTKLCQACLHTINDFKAHPDLGTTVGDMRRKLRLKSIRA